MTSREKEIIKEALRFYRNEQLLSSLGCVWAGTPKTVVEELKEEIDLVNEIIKELEK